MSIAYFIVLGLFPITLLHPQTASQLGSCISLLCKFATQKTHNRIKNRFINLKRFFHTFKITYKNHENLIARMTNTVPRIIALAPLTQIFELTWVLLLPDCLTFELRPIDLRGSTK